MKTALIFISLYLVFSAELSAQQKISVPTANEFSDYLHDRQKQIEQKIYNLALQRKIKAYKTDSFKSVYDSATFALRGTRDLLNSPDNKGVNTIIVDGNVKLLAFNPLETKGLIFLKKVLSKPGETEDRSRLAGVAVLYQPEIAGFLLRRQPMFWTDIEELRKVLTADELKFLNLIYYYCQNNNSGFDILGYTEDYTYDYFLDLNNRQSVYITPDTALYKKLISMLTKSEFYIDLLLYPEVSYYYNEPGGSGNARTAEKPIIYDEQQKKYIRLSEFQDRYKQKITVFISTDMDDPTKGRDSTFTEWRRFENIHAISFDNAGKQLLKYHFIFKKDGNDKQDLMFYIDVKQNAAIDAVKPIIWFYEDYIRWKKL